MLITDVTKTINAPGQVSAEEGFKKLIEGNARFVSGKSSGCYSDQHFRRKALIDNQKPFAIVLGCSDSRVPPEILFDQGIGELFIIRVAGNVLGLSEIDSMTYAVEVLGCPLVIVLGHENCGAVNAVWRNQADMIPFLKKEIYLSLDHQDPEATLASQVKNNVRHTVDLIHRTSQFNKKIEAGNLKVIGAFYPFVSGQVEFFLN